MNKVVRSSANIFKNVKGSLAKSFFSYLSLCLMSLSRPLEDEPFAIVSEPKRPILESSISLQAPKTPVTSEETYRLPAATSEARLGSAADLFVGQSEAQSGRISRSVQKEPWSRKRKEMEAEIQMDELESIMSEDMDFFDEPPSDKGQQAQPIQHSSAEKKQGLDIIEASFASKRQRVSCEENGNTKKPQRGLEKESASLKNQSQKSEQLIVSVKTEQVHPLEAKTTYRESSKPPEVSSATTSTKIEPIEDEASFIEVRTYFFSVLLLIQ